MGLFKASLCCDLQQADGEFACGRIGRIQDWVDRDISLGCLTECSTHSQATLRVRNTCYQRIVEEK